MDIMDIAIAKALSGGGGGGGGSSAFIVNAEYIYDYETSSYSVNSIDKSFADILNAYNNGAVIMARVHESGSESSQVTLYLHDISTNGEFDHAQFITFNVDIYNESLSSIMAETLYIDSSTAVYNYGYHSF